MLHSYHLLAILKGILSRNFKMDYFPTFHYYIDCKGLGYNRLKRIPNHFCNGTKLMYIELQMNQIDKLRRLQFAECEYVRSM
ncbi:hypothetical protein TrispH2_007674 [Trichoplax sp. H2]|nr:hypothetical protein TrispH2_007674 [Trichoplax sp. H2]|eukprot:RDD40244.1 hypothetical protein TrispH2_007674 [Trichoplax sp. H2]